MRISDEVKKQILEGFIEVFPRISNKEYQKRVWIRGEGPEVDDLDDTVCDFFDACEPILETYKDFGITDEQYSLLLKFRDAFDAFCDGPTIAQFPPGKFIDTPEWENITVMAKEVLIAFDYQQKSPNPAMT